jgi:hypothetical protein
MRIFLIIVTIFMGIGILLVSVKSLTYQSDQLNVLFILIAVLMINGLCAYYLYKKVSNNKVEWALFGFIGNINAILFYYCRNYVMDCWTRNKSIFRD